MKIAHTIFFLSASIAFLSLCQPVSLMILNDNIHDCFQLLFAFLAAILILFALRLFPSLCLTEIFYVAALSLGTCY